MKKNHPKFLVGMSLGSWNRLDLNVNYLNLEMRVYYAGSVTRPGGNSEFHLVDERIVG